MEWYAFRSKLMRKKTNVVSFKLDLWNFERVLLWYVCVLGLWFSIQNIYTLLIRIGSTHRQNKKKEQNLIILWKFSSIERRPCMPNGAKFCDFDALFRQFSRSLSIYLSYFALALSHTTWLVFKFHRSCFTSHFPVIFFSSLGYGSSIFSVVFFQEL